MKTRDLKSLYPIWVALAKNQRYAAYVSEKDVETFLRRCSSEGLPFLTVLLPSIGKSLDRFHSKKEWVCPDGFGRRDYHTDRGVITLPEFLNGAVFHAVVNRDPLAVDCVRQLTLMFYKLEVDYDEKSKEKFASDFKTVDATLMEGVDHLDSYSGWLIRYARTIIDAVLKDEDPFEIVPSHGGGATACHTPNSEKFYRLRYFKKLDESFPYDSHFFVSPSHLLDRLEHLEASPEVVVPTARICFVPKDSRGPRVISCEPAEMMFIQQGLMKKLYQILEDHPLTSGQLNFTDQCINQELARVSSFTGENATLDLSEASDRVAWALVRFLFPEPWVQAFDACRSELTALPSGEVVKLRKFAPMGSACCFPVEAMVFWAIAQASLVLQRVIESYRNVRSDTRPQEAPKELRWTFNNLSNGPLWAEFSFFIAREYRLLSKTLRLKGLPDAVYVYGDDIVVNSHFSWLTIEALESVGLVVNKDKSFTGDYFRESCGKDYYLGVDVTPIRVRKFPGSSETSFVTDAELCNNFIAKLGNREGRRMLCLIEELTNFIFPRTNLPRPGCVSLNPETSNDVFFRSRFNTDYQRREHRILATVPVVRQVHSPDWEELFRKLLTASDRQTGDDFYGNITKVTNAVLHPGWYAESHSVITKWVWTWLG